MRFLFFCGVLSLLHVAKVDMVYIYGDKPLNGSYWDLLINTGQNVKWEGFWKPEIDGATSYCVPEL